MVVISCERWFISTDLVLKEDKKLQKMTTRESIKVDSKYLKGRQPKVRKPRYGLGDYGCLVPQNQESHVPVDHMLDDNNVNLCETDVQILLRKNLLSLRYGWC